MRVLPRPRRAPPAGRGATGMPGVPATELGIEEAAATPAADVLDRLGSGPGGLTEEEAERRRDREGANAVRRHRARPWTVLARQLRSPVLVLLGLTAIASVWLGEGTDAAVIGVILVASVGLGFTNEYRAERATELLHSRIAHRVVVVRDGQPSARDVTTLTRGDVITLSLGELVPADVRLLSSTGLECDESVLTGESLPVAKQASPVGAGTPVADLCSCALMGTVVSAGSGTGVVVATGPRAQFGRIAAGLGDRHPETQFQAGLRRFSMLLLEVAVVLTGLIFVANVLLARPLIDALLFSLAIAVGITPQLLPAVVSASLATGSRHLATKSVLIKRLVCIEDLGDIDLLVTDKTGTLTEGRVTFSGAIDAGGAPDDDVAALALGTIGHGPQGPLPTNPLDAALVEARPPGTVGAAAPAAVLPFDHDRQMSSALVDTPRGRLLVVKGAPEAVMARCTAAPAGAQTTVQDRFAAGARIVAVASRPAPGRTDLTVEDERDLALDGFVTFLDRPKPAARESLRRLAALGISVKVATGDNPVVAAKVCAELGLPVTGCLTGADVAAMDDEALLDAAVRATVFARVGPDQKARIIALLRRRGRTVGFLGDGVNDALALHAADIGISVDTATDVAKDAADAVLLEKDLDVLADGVVEGRRIFANTMKYVFMGTSSNFGNMFSAAAASAVLPFLPMLPSQILLNNLLYDASQLTIPTDRVDDEQLRAPSHWDIGRIRRFMLVFGPLSSLFDFVTFALMLGVFRAGPELFHSGWFAESLATQTLVIFVIRTRRSPFTRSRPGGALTVAVLAAALTGVLLPYSPLAALLGFTPLPSDFLLALVGLVLVYLVLAEVAKRRLFAQAGPSTPAPAPRRRGREHRIHRHAARFSVGPGNPDRRPLARGGVRR
ncbi:magnesium-translocating P-type ATPase [Actinomycetospora chlora]|uniref:magnesium-translocating P-type ATPase n=1 Tax=Actinomycetospora chlora TaxID=663608 RepID=UPI0031E6A4C9